MYVVEGEVLAQALTQAAALGEAHFSAAEGVVLRGVEQHQLLLAAQACLVVVAVVVVMTTELVAQAAQAISKFRNSRENLY